MTPRPPHRDLSGAPDTLAAPPFEYPMSTSQPNGVATSRALVVERLTSRFEAWRGLPLRVHLIAVATLAAVLTLRWWQFATSSTPLNDELIYIRAFRNAMNGLSPFERSGYLAFSLLAHLGGWWLERFGQVATLAALRSANVMGVATAVWCALAWAPWSTRRRWIVAAVYLVLAPAVSFGMFVANLSLAVSGMIVVALFIWPHRPLASGALLAGSIIAKPLAPGAIIALLSHRPAERTRAHLLAAGSALALTAVIVLGSPELERALSLDPWSRLDKSVSPHKIAYLLGLRQGALWISIGMAALTVWIARQRPIGPTQVLALATAAAVATTPVVWSHTLLVTLPLQTVALAILAERYGGQRGSERTPTERHHRLIEICAVLLAVAALQLSTGAWNIYDSPVLIQWLGLLPPMLAPWVLVAYVLRRTPAF